MQCASNICHEIASHPSITYGELLGFSQASLKDYFNVLFDPYVTYLFRTLKVLVPESFIINN
jgi:hypothetical protein